MKERFDARTFLVFDIFSDLYDPDTAHEDQTDFNAVLVSLSENQTVNPIPEGMVKDINRMVRDIHNDTGLGSRPPFSVDHANGKIPRYGKPRIPRQRA